MAEKLGERRHAMRRSNGPGDGYTMRSTKWSGCGPRMATPTLIDAAKGGASASAE